MFFFSFFQVSDYENESFRIVNEALAKLGGTLIPLDSLTVAGSLHWSSIYYNTKWANHLFLDVNSPQQLSHFGNFLEKKSDVDDGFPSLPSNNKAVSKDQNKRSKHQVNGRGLLPVTSVLDHFIKGPCAIASALIKDGGNLTRQPHIEATLGFHQSKWMFLLNFFQGSIYLLLKFTLCIKYILKSPKYVIVTCVSSVC